MKANELQYFLVLAFICLTHYRVYAADRLPRFQDVTTKFGFERDRADKTSAPSVADLNQDGYPDIVMCGHVNDPTLVFFGSAKGFRKTVYFNYKEDRHGTAIGDINGDGLLDIIITVDADKPSVPRILMYEGNKRFKEVPAEDVGLDGRLGRGVAARFFDIDGDGDLDLFLLKRPPIGEPKSLVRNTVYENVGGRFVLRPSTGLEGGRTIGMLVLDYNMDGILDILLIGQFFELYEGDGQFGFKDVTKLRVPRRYSRVFSGAAAFDYDNDGDFDIYLGAGARGKEEYVPGDDVLLENRNGTFVDVSLKAKLPRGGVHTGLTFGDLDNDGYLDVFLPREGPGRSRIPDLILMNRGRRGGRIFVPFEDLGHNGPNDRTQATGAQVLDYDRDGRLDIIVSSRRPTSDGSLRLYRNIARQSNYFIVDLPSKSSDGISTLDALVEIVSAGQTLTQRVGGQGEFRTQSFLTTVHFGLGEAESVGKLTITLSTGRKRSFQPLGGFAVNRKLIFKPTFLK